MVQASPWQVERLDWTGRKAFVTKTRADYYTDAIDYTKLKILDRFERARVRAGTCAHGEVHLVRRIPGYKKIRYYTHENIGYGNIHLPDQELHTTAVWWQADSGALLTAFPNRSQALDGFLGAAYAIHHVAALLTMSERQDLGRAVGDADSTWSAIVGADGRGAARSFDGQPVDVEHGVSDFQPTVYLYDSYPGGVGLSAPLFDLRHQVAERARDLVAGCDCRHGCPACVGPILASDEERGYSPKGAARAVLDILCSPTVAAPE
jgi:DEAD/DEAH box helicase domain-containing protein